MVQRLLSIRISWDNITKAQLINFFSALYFYLPIATLWYQSKGLSLTQVASLTGILIGTIFLTNIPTGAFADKIGRKLSIIIALLLQVLGEILFLRSSSYFHFIGVSIIAGLGFAFMTGAFEALIYDSLKELKREDRMKKVMGSIEATKGFATVIGAAASSFILSRLTPDRFAMAIMMTIGTVGLGLVVSLFLKEPKQVFSNKQRSTKTLIVTSIRVLKTNTRLRKIVLLAIITTPFVGYLQSLYQPYFKISGVPGPLFGLSLSIGGILTILGTKYAYVLEKKIGAKIAILTFTILPGLFYILMASTFSPALAILLFCLNYGSMSLQEPLFADYMNRHIASAERATVLSTISMLSSLYIALMGPLIGKLADSSLSLAFLFMGSLVIAGAVLFRIDESHLVGSST